VQLVRLDRPATVQLPANSFPLTFSGHRVVCELLSTTGMQPTRLVVFDIALHRVIRDLGPASSFTASQNVLVWTSQPCSAATTCQLHTYDVRTETDTTRGYALPVEAGLAGGVLSPDGHRLAFQLTRMTADPRYTTTLPGAPSDLVLLDL